MVVAIFGMVWIVLFVAIAFILAVVKLKVDLYEALMKFLGALVLGIFFVDWFDKSPADNTILKVFFFAIGLTALFVSMQHAAKAK
jgi:hypothetical protein